ncbi:uncharacterized protein [Clytia hemisphaerica]
MVLESEINNSLRQKWSLIISGSIAFISGTLSLFSHHTRCILMLILPGMITGKGRASLLSMAIGFLMEGPINNINNNINEAVESSTCMYKFMKDLPEFPFVNVPNVDDIQLKILTAIKELFDDAQYYYKNIGNFFFIGSLIILIFDSIRYLKQYYTDDEFDNKIVDDNLRSLWRENGDNYDKLTPLRRWEKKLKYRKSSALRLTREELQKTFLKALIALVVIMVSVFVILGDAALYTKLNSLTTSTGANADGHVDKPTTNSGITDWLKPKLKDVKSKVKKTISKYKNQDLLMKSCPLKPFQSSKLAITTISILLGIILLSCIFDAYGMRLRSRICNLFYPDRAHDPCDLSP